MLRKSEKMKTKKMMKRNDRKYSRITTLAEIRDEKERLRKKLHKQEKKVADDWERIEHGWRFVGRIFGTATNLVSSASMLGGIEIGYKLLSYFFSKRKKKEKL